MAVKGNTITAFLDESGKFKDHKVICFGGVYSYNENFNEFGEDGWRRTVWMFLAARLR
jgi:hypothetical protein